MQYWRMQLHPSDGALATRYAVESLAQGFIGLDFKCDAGDLRRPEARTGIKDTQQDYVDIAERMEVGDVVLVVVHHFPFALVTVSGQYNYIAHREERLGVWFRHFRPIDRTRTRYYADWETDARKWEHIPMTDTISILKDPTSRSYRLIEEWRKAFPE